MRHCGRKLRHSGNGDETPWAQLTTHLHRRSVAGDAHGWDAGHGELMQSFQRCKVSPSHLFSRAPAFPTSPNANCAAPSCISVHTTVALSSHSFFARILVDYPYVTLITQLITGPLGVVVWRVSLLGRLFPFRPSVRVPFVVFCSPVSTLRLITVPQDVASSIRPSLAHVAAY